MQKQKIIKLWELVAVLALLIFAMWGLCSCVDVIRGNQSITHIHKVTQSALSLYFETDATVQADKVMTDSMKSAAEAQVDK